MSFLPDLSRGHARLAKLRLSKLARPRVNTHPLAFSLARTVLPLLEKLERVASGAFPLFSLVLCRSTVPSEYVTRNRINKTTHQTTHPTSRRDVCRVTKCTRLPPRFYTQCDKSWGVESGNEATLWPVHVTLLTRSCDDFHVTENGLGLRASLPIPTVQLHNYWTGLHTRVQALPSEWGGQSIAHVHQFYHSVTPPSYITISVLSPVLHLSI